jgi:hypothetical protein
MVTIWWFWHGVIHYSFLRSGQAVTADIYCAELRTMLAELAVKQPRLMNDLHHYCSVTTRYLIQHEKPF